jgi:hypothetical protein
MRSTWCRYHSLASTTTNTNRIIEQLLEGVWSNTRSHRCKLRRRSCCCHLLGSAEGVHGRDRLLVPSAAIFSQGSDESCLMRQSRMQRGARATMQEEQALNFEN